MRQIVYLLTVTAICATPAIAQGTSPLDIDDVVELIRLSPSAETRASFIRKSCVSFPLNTSATARLKTAGASDDMLDVIRNACFSGTQIVVDSRPAGAEVLVDGQPVGKAPWTGRFASASRSLTVTARLRGATQTANAPLDAGKLVKASFSFPEDTTVVPEVRSTADIVTELGLESRWKPTVAPPRAPREPSAYGNFLVSTLVLGAASYGGFKFCEGAASGCGFKPKFDEEGTDTNEPYRLLVGGLAGAVGGTIVNKLIGTSINSARRRNYEGNRAEYLRKQADWNRTMEGARAEWLRSHPDVQRIGGNETLMRQRTLESNRAIKASNSALPPSAVTVEAIGASPGR